MPREPLPLSRQRSIAFRGGRDVTGVKAVPTRYDVFERTPERVGLPDFPEYLGVVVRYADGTWLAVTRNGSKVEAQTRGEAVRRAWW